MFQLLRYTKLIKYWHLHMKVRESTTIYSHISFGHIGHTSKKVLSILIRVHLISIGIAVTKCKCCTGSALGVRNNVPGCISSSKCFL